MLHSIFEGAAAAPLPTLGLALAAPASAPLLTILVDAGRRAREAAIAGIRAGGCRTRVDRTGAEMPTADGMRVARRVYGSGGDGPMPRKTDETIRFWVNDPGGRAPTAAWPDRARTPPQREAAMSSIVAVFGASSGLAALLAGALFSGVFDDGPPKPARAGAAETDGGQRVFEVDGQTSGPTSLTCLVAEHC